LIVERKGWETKALRHATVQQRTTHTDQVVETRHAGHAPAPATPHAVGGERAAASRATQVFSCGSNLRRGRTKLERRGGVHPSPQPHQHTNIQKTDGTTHVLPLLRCERTPQTKKGRQGEGVKVTRSTAPPPPGLKSRGRGHQTKRTNKQHGYAPTRPTPGSSRRWVDQAPHARLPGAAESTTHTQSVTKEEGGTRGTSATTL